MSLNHQSNHGLNLPTRANVVLGIALPFYALAFTMVSARILVKSKLGKLGVEDLLIGISVALALGVMIATIIACRFGFGMHTTDFLPEWQVPYGRILYASVAMCSPCMFFTKTSMICFYLRLAPHPKFRIICYVSITITTLCWGAMFLVNTFGCFPMSGGWNKDSVSSSHKCITTPLFFRISVLFNLITDILVMLLPIPILMRMQLKIKTKIGLVFTFSMGFLTTAVCAMCLHTVSIAMDSSDITWDGAYTWLWSLLELSFGIMTACMPAMLLFVRWLKGEYSDVKVPGAGGGQGSTIGGGARKKRIPEAGILGSTGSDGFVLNDVSGICKAEVMVVTSPAPKFESV